MIQEQYETILVDGTGKMVGLEHGQTWRVTMTKVHIQEADGIRLVQTVHYVVAE